MDTGVAGWSGTIPAFIDEESRQIRLALEEFVEDAGDSQIRAWQNSIPQLKAVMSHYLGGRSDGNNGAVLEYALPMEQGRRPDVIVLDNGLVVVLELKGYGIVKQEDLDQASAYARDLRHYHSMCRDRDVIAILVPLQRRGPWEEMDDVLICGPDLLPGLLQQITAKSSATSLNSDEFLSGDYEPMPTLVEAARRMFEDGDLPNIRRARAATDPALETSMRILKNAAETRSRKLILLSGVPGAGKTLVGIRLSYDRSTLSLAVPRLMKRAGGIEEYVDPTITSVFLSGNGPLVEVLQDALGKESKNFVRPVRGYVKHHFGERGSNRVPNEHVLIFDEAQRAWDREKVERGHKGEFIGSEPDLFVNMAERIPEWSVVVGLIGTGQEIHDGEESGIQQWVDAVASSNEPDRWEIHAPPKIANSLESGTIKVHSEEFLSLDVTLRSHFAEKVHEWVDGLIGGTELSAIELSEMGKKLQSEGFRMYWTDNLAKAKSYIMNRYEGMKDKRYGLIASSRDKALAPMIPNDFMSTKNVRKGAWFNAEQHHPRSGCQLNTCMTEFGVQGLELDFCLVGWGTDYVLRDGIWSNHLMKNHARGVPVKDPLSLRRNAYRVLLTRARDGFAIYIPNDDGLEAKHQGSLEETRNWLQSCGITKLSD
jgi:hypothetical protein